MSASRFFNVKRTLKTSMYGVRLVVRTSLVKRLVWLREALSGRATAGGAARARWVEPAVEATASGPAAAEL